MPCGDLLNFALAGIRLGLKNHHKVKSGFLMIIHIYAKVSYGIINPHADLSRLLALSLVLSD
ncbi:hypothetical protein SPONN_1187 [uncultured Candidatus Thioglobus sp.]|nr:hypothetical protein SPONN_1187 [uncultured Candidatus Thioglobus sp.]